MADSVAGPAGRRVFTRFEIALPWCVVFARHESRVPRRVALVSRRSRWMVLPPLNARLFVCGAPIPW